MPYTKELTERFPSYHYCRSQLIYYITIVVSSYEHGIEKIVSFSNIQANVNHSAM